MKKLLEYELSKSFDEMCEFIQNLSWYATFGVKKKSTILPKNTFMNLVLFNESNKPI
jgi:hypothetical protein